MKRWQVRWRPPDDGADKDRIEKTFGTKGEALDWIAAEDRKHKTGTWVDPRKGDKPFKDVAAEWLATKAHLEPTTYTGYGGTIDAWYTADRDPLGRRPPFNRKIGAIGAPQIESWLEGFQPARSYRTIGLAKVVVLLGADRTPGVDPVASAVEELGARRRADGDLARLRCPRRPLPGER